MKICLLCKTPYNLLADLGQIVCCWVRKRHMCITNKIVYLFIYLLFLVVKMTELRLIIIRSKYIRYKYYHQSNFMMDFCQR